ncbi:helix-turn-helix domain-containing protein [Cohnella soli]|uniref:Helix-turn-helix domain-containing protein n=1 Tax=Cohnella soli TaxID=425005 RepID=A0ABW0HT82_9BACL
MTNVIFEELARDEGFHCHETDYSGGAWEVAPHWHYYIEMVYIKSGKAQAYVNDEMYLLNEGDFVFIDSLMIHSFFGESDWNTRIVVVKFNKQLILPSSQFSEPLFLQLMAADHRLFRFGLHFQRQETNGSDIAGLFPRLAAEIAQTRFGYELAIRTMIGQLFLWVIREREEQYEKLSGLFRDTEPFYKPIQRMMEHIAAHYQEPLDARKAAKMCNMSYSYFSRKFKLVAGRTFSEHLNLIRIMEAEKLLIGSDLSVTDIAMQAGYANTSYFIKQFQRVRSISPMQYRKKLLRGSAADAPANRPAR